MVRNTASAGTVAGTGLIRKPSGECGATYSRDKRKSPFRLNVGWNSPRDNRSATLASHSAGTMVSSGNTRDLPFSSSFRRAVRRCTRTAVGPPGCGVPVVWYSSGMSGLPAIRQEFGPEESTTPISGRVLHRGSLNRHASHVRQHPCQRHPALTHLNHARVQTHKTAPRRRRQTIRRNSRLQLADPCDQCTNRQCCCLYTIGWRGIAFFSTCAFKSSIILSSLRVSQFSQ